MSKTTGPVIAAGAITITNRVVFSGQPMDWRVPIATGLTAIGFNLAERVWPTGAQILAWTALTTMILTRTDPRTPSPAENALAWWQKGK